LLFFGTSGGHKQQQQPRIHLREFFLEMKAKKALFNCKSAVLLFSICQRSFNKENKLCSAVFAVEPRCKDKEKEMCAGVLPGLKLKYNQIRCTHSAASTLTPSGGIAHCPRSKMMFAIKRKKSSSDHGITRHELINCTGELF
jgi:hypothetical protein